MINSYPRATENPAAPDQAVHRIVGAGAPGAIALAGVATAVVVAVWLAFYVFVFVSRASVP